MPINPLIIQVVSITTVLVFLFFISRLILKGKLREEYAIIWFFCGVILLVFSSWRDGLELVAGWLGVHYAPSLLFMFGILVIIFFLVHLSVVNSKQQEQIKQLSQELGLLKKKLEDRED